MYLVESLHNRIKQAFEEISFIKEPGELYEPIEYTIKNAGKRIRPLLVLLDCDLFGGDIEDAIYPAIAIELFHNFTLIHDDIMDKATLRRGKETVYIKWNPDIAILSGDTMFAIAYQYIAKTKPEFIYPVLDAFTSAAIKVCEGQQYDMNYEKTEAGSWKLEAGSQKSEVRIPDYINMIRLKTAALLAGSLRIGAITGKANEPDIDNIYKFGENIGIAFQIMDDMLDVYGNTEKFGKTNCGDIKTNKKTYLYLKAFELAKGNKLDALKNYFKSQEPRTKSQEERGQMEEEKIKGVKGIYDALNIKDYALKEIDNYYNKALEYFNSVNVAKDRKTTLLEFTEKLIKREY